MDYTTTWLEADFVLMLEPVTSLKTNTTYTLEVGAGAMSAFGMP